MELVGAERQEGLTELLNKGFNVVGEFEDLHVGAEVLGVTRELGRFLFDLPVQLLLLLLLLRILLPVFVVAPRNC